jgi:hypothetical protein
MPLVQTGFMRLFVERPSDYSGAWEIGAIRLPVLRKTGVAAR